MSDPIRIGLVLGAGGLLGQSFHVGTLHAIREVTGYDARDADVIVGTSAGSGIGTFLRYGLSPGDLSAGYRGEAPSAAAAEAIQLLGPPVDLSGGPTLKFRGLERELLARIRRRIRNVPPMVALGALLPDGRLSTEEYRDQVRRLTGMSWPTADLLICAVRRRDGRRVVFGNHHDTPIDVADAVAASSAVPGFFAPVVLNGEEYLDGGLHSPTNADVLKTMPLHLVIVVSPMTAPTLEGMTPRMIMRRHFRNRLNRELEMLTAAGIPTAVIEPTDAISDVMNGASMDREMQGPVIALAQEHTTDWLSAGAQRFVRGIFSRSAESRSRSR